MGGYVVSVLEVDVTTAESMSEPAGTVGEELGERAVLRSWDCGRTHRAARRRFAAKNGCTMQQEMARLQYCTQGP